MTPWPSRSFVFFLTAMALEMIGLEMLSLAVGWQVYALTARRLDLGYVGLAQFAPAFVLSLFAGQVADRIDRRRIVLACTAVFTACTLLLYAISLGRHVHVSSIYAVLVLLGAARAFSGPATNALIPMLVPTERLSRAIAWESGVWQLSVIVGPSIGGAIYAVGGGAHAVYATAAAIDFGAVLCVAAVHVDPHPRAPIAGRWRELWAGVRFVREHPIVLGSISLDLFAVLLGGAVALLPAIAHDVLGVGTVGLGMLRSAPAVGAGAMALLLARRPMARHAGIRMLACVALFGAATVVFGWSHNFVLSLAALVVVGASDMVSVVVRRALIQLATPDAMRGRVNAVNMVFVGASNELGQFESGFTAEILGTVPAVVAGGIGTIVVVLLWAVLFPALARVDRVEDV